MPIAKVRSRCPGTWTTREPEALALLKSALSDSDADVRREALRSMDRGRQWLSHWPSVARSARCPASEIGAIVKTLFDSGSASEQVAAADKCCCGLLTRGADRVQGWKSAERIRRCVGCIWPVSPPIAASWPVSKTACWRCVWRPPSV